MAEADTGSLVIDEQTAPPVDSGVADLNLDDETEQSEQPALLFLTPQQQLSYDKALAGINDKLKSHYPNYLWRDFVLQSSESLPKIPVMAYVATGKKSRYPGVSCEKLDSSKQPDDVLVEKWTIPKDLSDQLNKYGKEDYVKGWQNCAGCFLAAPKDLVCIVQYHDGSSCKSSHSHLHVLVGSKTSAMTTNWYKRQGKSTPWNRTSFDVTNNPAIAFMHNIRSGEGRTYLGCNSEKLLKMIKNTRAWVSANTWVPLVYAGGLGVTEDDTTSGDEDYFGFAQLTGKRPADFGQDPIPTKKVCAELQSVPISTSLLIKAKHSDAERDIIEAICREYRIKNVEMLKSILHMLPGNLNKLIYHKLLYKEKQIGTHIDSYWRQSLRMSVKDIACHAHEMFAFGMMHYGLISLIFAHEPWVYAILRVCALLSGHAGKRGCVFISGAADCGKTTLFSHALEWIHPRHHNVKINGEKALTGLHKSAHMCVQDDVEPIITRENVELLKCWFGGTGFKIDVKYGDISDGCPCPVIWLSNASNFIFIDHTHRKPIDKRVSYCQVEPVEWPSMPYKQLIELLIRVWPYFIVKYNELFTQEDFDSLNEVENIVEFKTRVLDFSSRKGTSSTSVKRQASNAVESAA